MIVDAHAHVFPFIGGSSGYASPEEHLAYLQRNVYFPINPIRRRTDEAAVEEQTLWNGVDHGPEGLLPVGFRPGRFGRLEWTKGEVDYYLQYFAPSLQDNACASEYLLAEMDYAGVGVAVLQNEHTYGYLDDYVAECVRRHPGRFVGLHQVREALAHTDGELAALERAAHQLGLKGVFFHALGFFPGGFRDRLDDPRFDVFWCEVVRLGLVAFWHLTPLPDRSSAGYVEQLERVAHVLSRHPGLTSVLVMGFPLGLFAPEGQPRLPAVARELAACPRFHVELTYTVSCGRDWDYPYAECLPLVEALCETFGPRRLVWGSDMPNVLRFCTYRQSLDYLRRYATFLSEGDKSLIFGENLARLFGL